MPCVRRRAASIAFVLALGVLRPEHAAIGGTLYSPAQHVQTGTTTVSVALGDLDGNGLPDIAATNSNSANLSLLFQGPLGTFTRTDVAVGSGPRSVAIADFNRDSRLDLAVASQGTSEVSVLLREEAGGYARNDLAVGQGCLFVSVADLDRDALADIVTANPSSADLTLRFGRGDGSFDSAVSLATAGVPYSIAIGDLNGDLIPDLAVANRSLDAASILLATGPGTFAPAVTVPMGNDPVSVALGDLDQDGDLDLVTANRGPGVVMDSTISVRLGNGDGTFGPRSDFVVERGPEAVAIGDLDRDGRLDVAVVHVGISGVVAVLRGRGDGGFEPRDDYPTGGSPRHLAIGDLDGDGKPDLATANYQSNSVSILINQGQPQVSVDDGEFRAIDLAAWPNPARSPSVSFAFTLAAPGPARLRVFDVTGRLVRTLISDVRPAGRHRVRWDGGSDGGDRAPPGLYRCVLETDAGTEVVAVTWLR